LAGSWSIEIKTKPAGPAKLREEALGGGGASGGKQCPYAKKKQKTGNLGGAKKIKKGPVGRIVGKMKEKKNSGGRGGRIL